MARPEDLRYAEVARLRDDYVRKAASSDLILGGQRHERDDLNAYALRVIKETDDLYFVSEDICSTIEAAEASLPDFKVTADLFPTLTGFARFAIPFKVRVPDAAALGQPEITVMGAAWFPVNARAIEEDETAPTVSASYLVYVIEPTPKAVFSYGFLLLHDTNMLDVASGGGPILQVLRRMMTLFLFMQQRLAVTETRRLPRHVRRASAGKPPEGVKVIQFRRPEKHEVEGGGDGQPVNWSCRWIVRGHWRQQWYGPKGSGLRVQRPLWIAQFIKGPDDKPLVFRPHVFDVSR